MTRFVWPLSLAVVGFLTATSQTAPPETDAEKARRVAALVARLGDDDFDRREAAHKALVELGPAVIPLLDKLDPPGDPEVAERVRRIRLAVGGFAEEIRSTLAALPPLPDHESRQALPEPLSRLIADHQPKSGDVLLALVVDPKHPHHRQAVNAFVQTWDTMTAGQIETYLGKSLTANVYMRPKYPRGAGGMVGFGYQFRYGWASRPPGDNFKFVTRTTHYLDGKPYGEPYTYPYASSGCTTGWVQTGDLAVGKHAVRAVIAYEAEHRGKKITGEFKSPVREFTMTPADTPDDLIAPPDAAVDKRVRAAFHVGETDSDVPMGRGQFVPKPFAQDAADQWRPQITWQEKDGKGNGLHAPVWALTQPLPVDLCFEVTIRVEKTGEEFRGDPVIVYKNSTPRGGYFSPRDVDGLAKGRSGFVPVRVILKPSRLHALSDPKVSSYFPGEITSGVVRIKVGPAEEPEGGRK